MTDEELAQNVAAALSEDPKVDGTLIDVVADGGEVLLRGTVGSFWQKREAQKAAERVDGVTAVDNIIDVRLLTEHRRADAELRSDVLHALSLNGMIPGTVDASVDDGTVLLSGTVDLEHQREEAVRIAGNVRGVVNVDNDIFLNPPLTDGVTIPHDGAMQFYLSGYPERPHLPATTDVLIVGAGPAGLVLAAQLANFPEVRCIVVDRRDGPLEVGQADGVACRTVEMFETFGLARRLIHEGYQVNEVAFWRPDPRDPARIVRTGRIDDVEEGISEMPHMIVNQARMLGYLRELLPPGQLFYGLRATGVDISPGGVTVAFEQGQSIRASYVVGCDGAHSTVREAIGRRLAGDTTDQYWGVLDVLAVTDFPDIRLKSVIQSSHGSILVIPREGGYLVRLYIELGSERPPNPSPQTLLEVANRILHPYEIEVKNVGWWTVYEIGQRLCDGFDDGGEVPRVFIAGDACHTHSAKAGQGMNVSMADAFNLGWKLGAVLRGTAPPAILRTYSEERRRVAEQLIDFDREFAGSLSARPDGFQEYFREQGRFTAGLSVRYEPSMLTAPPTHQHLASGFPIGMRLHSAPVVRVADAKPMHLGHAARADGAWRLYVFADRSRTRLLGFCDFLTSGRSPLTRCTPPGADPDAIIDVRAILQQPHREVAVDELPPVLQPRKGRYRLIDYEKVFTGDDVFTARGVDREQGCVVVVRPDQYVANVLPLDAYEELDAFLNGVLVA